MEARPETGVMRFGEDWPGVFVRGDTAAILAKQLAGVIGEPDPGAGPDTLDGLLSLLKSASRDGAAALAQQARMR